MGYGLPVLVSFYICRPVLFSTTWDEKGKRACRGGGGAEGLQHPLNLQKTILECFRGLSLSHTQTPNPGPGHIWDFFLVRFPLGWDVAERKMKRAGGVEMRKSKTSSERKPKERKPRQDSTEIHHTVAVMRTEFVDPDVPRCSSLALAPHEDLSCFLFLGAKSGHGITFWGIGRVAGPNPEPWVLSFL